MTAGPLEPSEEGEDRGGKREEAGGAESWQLLLSAVITFGEDFVTAFGKDLDLASGGRWGLAALKNDCSGPVVVLVICNTESPSRI